MDAQACAIPTAFKGDIGPTVHISKPAQHRCLLAEFETLSISRDNLANAVCAMHHDKSEDMWIGDCLMATRTRSETKADAHWLVVAKRGEEVDPAEE